MMSQEHICHANHYGGFGTLTELPAEYYRGYCDSHLKICGGRMVEFNIKLPSCSVTDWQHTCECDKEQVAITPCWEKNAWDPNGCGGQNEGSPHGNRGQMKWNPNGYGGQAKWYPYG